MLFGREVNGDVFAVVFGFQVRFDAALEDFLPESGDFFAIAARYGGCHRGPPGGFRRSAYRTPPRACNRAPPSSLRAPFAPRSSIRRNAGQVPARCALSANSVKFAGRTCQ